MDHSCIFVCIIYLLKSFLEFGSFICVCILCNLSKKNPFEKHYIGDLSNYFKDEINTSIPITSNEYIIFNNRINKEELIFNRSENILLNNDIKKNIFLRKLVSDSFCSEVHDDFKKYKGKQLSNIFDFNLYSILWKKEI